MAYVCLWVAQFSLYSQLRKWADADREACVFVGGAGRSTMVLEVNQRAWQCGARPGFSIARARARCGEELKVLRECSKSEREAQQDLLAVAEDLVPAYENTSAGCVIMDMAGLRLQQSESYRQWAIHTLEIADRLSMPVQLGMGPTPDLAWLSARCKETAMSRENTPTEQNCWVEGDACGPLAKAGVECLAALADIDVAMLRNWGVLTLAELLALDQQEMGERMGEAMHEVFAILQGSRHRLLRLHQAVRKLDREVFLEDSLVQVEQLLFSLQRTLSELCEQLRDSGEACQYVTLALVDDSALVWERRLKMAEPTDRAENFRMLMQSYLEKLELTAPIASYFIQLETTPHRYAARDMFKRSVKDANSLRVLLADLQNLLGEGNVGAPQLSDSHKPDSVIVVPWETAFEAQPGSAEPVGQSLLGLPLNRLRPPVPVVVVREAGGSPAAFLNGPVVGKATACRGPFRLMGGWWNGAQQWAVEEWDVEMECGEIIRVSYREKADRWMLEGRY